MRRLPFILVLMAAILLGGCKREGCTNYKSDNYDPKATHDDGSCLVEGCTNVLATNYDPIATVDDGTCFIEGCTNPIASNYNPQADVDDGSCLIGEMVFYAQPGYQFNFPIYLYVGGIYRGQLQQTTSSSNVICDLTNINQISLLLAPGSYSVTVQDPLWGGFSMGTALVEQGDCKKFGLY